MLIAFSTSIVVVNLAYEPSGSHKRDSPRFPKTMRDFFFFSSWFLSPYISSSKIPHTLLVALVSFMFPGSLFFLYVLSWSQQKNKKIAIEMPSAATLSQSSSLCSVKSLSDLCPPPLAPPSLFNDPGKIQATPIVFLKKKRRT